MKVKKVCRIEGCTNPVEARGFCKEHLADPQKYNLKHKPRVSALNEGEKK